MRRGSPSYSVAADSTYGFHYGLPRGLAVINEAVAQKRGRVRIKKVKKPATELGRDIQQVTGAPIRIINRTIRDTAIRKLKQLPVTGKPI